MGAPFDPEFHEAIAREANDDVPDGTVLQARARTLALCHPSTRATRTALRSASLLLSPPLLLCR